MTTSLMAHYPDANPLPPRLWVMAFLLLASAGCGGSGHAAGIGSGDVQALVEAVKGEITAGSMDVELDSLVQYDRLSGSPGEFASVDYLRRTLEAEGIQVRVDTFPAFISDPVSATVQVPGTGFAPEAITVSGSGDVQGLLGEVVDLGTLRDLPALLTETGERLILEAHGPAGSAPSAPIPDLAGRIALVTGQPRPDPVVQLTEMGAAGVVFVNPEERLNDLTTTSVWGGPSLMNYHRIPSLPVAQIRKSDGDRLRSMMASGRINLRMTTQTRTGWKELRLLTATIPGPAPDAPFVLAGGHLDAWYHGGTDNAGANVAMLELARAFHRHRDRLRRGMVVAWWPGHSNGRYAGSTWYVDNHFDELRRRAVAHVNFEGLGQMEAKRFGANASASLTEVAQSVIMSEVGEEVRPTPPGRNSDQSFNGVGLPLLQLNHSRLSEDGGYWWWHTPDDTRDKVDARVLKVDTDLYASALGRLLGEPVLPIGLSPVVERLGSILRARQEEAGDHFDFTGALRRQEELAEAVRQVENSIRNGSSSDAFDPKTDLAMVAVLRPLHRILYTLLGPYHPDPATTEGPLPGLNSVEILLEEDPTTDRYQFALTTLRRETHRIMEAMDASMQEAKGFLER